MGNRIALSIELDAIKSFLDKTLASIDEEIGNIINEKNRGKYTGFDDFENAIFCPLEGERIALRAVLYELNALIEWEFYKIALEAYFNSPKYGKRPKSFADVQSEDEIPRVKLVSDLPFSDICELIEKYYKINISCISGYEKIQIVRQSVNAFKHRKGFKDIRIDKGANLLKRFEINRNETYEAIEQTKLFIEQLMNITKV